MSTIMNIRAIVPLGTVSGTTTVDASKGNVFTMTLSAATAITVSNLKPGFEVFVQVAQTGAYAVTWAGQATGTVTAVPGGTVTYTFLGTSEAQGSGSATLIDATASSTVASSDEVVVYPTGTDDTTNINAVCAAGLFALLGPSGSTFYVNGSTNPVLTASNSGGIIGMGEGVEIQPTTGWVPGAGLVDDSTNAFFRVEGQDRSGGYTGTIAATVQVRGGNALTGIGSTTGVNTGAIIEVKATATGGSTLPQQRCMIRVASVSSGTALSLANPLRLMFGDGYNTLPAILTEITPVTRFRIQNVTFNTLGRNIAVGVNFVRCFSVATGSFTVTATATPMLLVERVRGKGFTKAIFAEACCDGIVYRQNYSAGLNNSCWYAETSHNWFHTEWRSLASGPAYATVGQVRPAFFTWAGGSDGHMSNNDISTMSSFAHVAGGFQNYFDNNTMTGPQADIRFTRDSITTAYIGAMYDGTVTATTNTDRAVDHHYGTAILRENYTNVTTYPLSTSNGVWGSVFVDSYGIAWDSFQFTNDGNGADALNGTMYAPGGGCYFFDCFQGGVCGEINARNVGGGALCVRQSGMMGLINSIRHDKKAGKSTGTQSNTAILLGTSGSRGVPRVGRVVQPNGGVLFDFDGTFFAAPDYEMNVGEYINIGSSTYWRDITYADNTSGANFVTLEVAILDPASAANKRAIAVAGADGTAPVILVQNSTNGSVAFVALGGGSVKTTGPVQPGNLLTTEGGVGHAAKVNAAATLNSVIGRALLALGAGTVTARVRAF